jgi:hypothetical protein
LQAQTTALVGARRVPVALRKPLLNGVAALVRASPSCVPPPAPTPVASVSSGTSKQDQKAHKAEKKKKHKGHGD